MTDHNYARKLSPIVIDISDDDEPNVGSAGEPSSPNPPTSTVPAIEDAETEVDEEDKDTTVILVDSDEDDDDEPNVGSAGEQSSPNPPTSTVLAIEDAETKVDEEDKGADQIIVDSEEEDDDDDDMTRTVSKPIVYGSVSRSLTRALSNGHAHEWTVYLRPRHNEDMSLYVRRVEFRFHSIPMLIRVFTKPPYEVTEVTGCGEFEVQIKLFFVDTSLPPVSLTLHGSNVSGDLFAFWTLIGLSYSVFCAGSESGKIRSEMHQVLEIYPNM